MTLFRAPGGGRRPLPTSVKEMRGTLRKHRLRPGEPRPPIAMPRPPRWLQGEARREWYRTVRKLHAMGLLTELDGLALAVLCASWARFAEAEEKLRRHGPVVMGPGGFPMPSPYLSIATKAQEQLMRALVEFGLTPSSRSRVEVVAVRPFDPVAEARKRRYFGTPAERACSADQKAKEILFGPAAAGDGDPPRDGVGR